jgi:hypothetical protein
MNIELKLTADDLQFLSSCFEQHAKHDAARFNKLKRDNKVVVSIVTDIADRICKKYEKLSRKPTLFDTKKKHHVTLKFHEGYALWMYLTGRLLIEFDPYNKSKIVKLHTLLDPHFAN